MSRRQAFGLPIDTQLSQKATELPYGVNRMITRFFSRKLDEVQMHFRFLPKRKIVLLFDKVKP